MAEHKTCVAIVPIFSGLSIEEQLDVASFATPTRVGRGEIIHAAGDDVSQLMVVHRGRVRITHLLPNGREQLLRVLEPGDFVGEGAFLSGERPDHFASALSETEMCLFQHRDLAELVRRHPGIALRMLRVLSLRLTEAERRVTALTSGDVESRLASYLLELPTQGRGTRVRLPLAKKDVASFLGTTPETLSRRLAQFTAAGLIRPEGARDIALLDVPALAEVAESGGALE